jgi:ABC-type phosphate/phosphonate transport system substrate-binding protein
MSNFIAALPMYDWPETRAETDAEWARQRDAFRSHGVDAPERMVRRNADLPPVPGGIRDSDGLVIAPDPASLPPDELDLHTLWLHPKLLFAQTCWGPMGLGLTKHVQVIGQPSYDAFAGGQRDLYSSAIVMRRDYPPEGSRWSEGPQGGGAAVRGVRTPSQRSAATRTRSAAGIHLSLKREDVGVPFAATSIPLDLLRGTRLAYNSLDSMSGIIALGRDLKVMGESLDIFSERLESGGHRASIVAIAEGRADVAAIDCRTWTLAQRFEHRASDVSAVGWTVRRKGLPYITSANTPAELVAKLRAALGGDGLDHPINSLLSSG